jgi:hypothetical protein
MQLLLVVVSQSRETRRNADHSVNSHEGVCRFRKVVAFHTLIAFEDTHSRLTMFLSISTVSFRIDVDMVV